MPDPYAELLGVRDPEEDPYAAFLRPSEPEPDPYATLLAPTPPDSTEQPETGFMGGLIGRLPDPVRERVELYGKSLLEGAPAGVSLAGSALKFLSGAGATEKIRERAAERGVGLVEPLAPVMDPIQRVATTVGTEMQRMAEPAMEAAKEERSEFRKEHPGKFGSVELVASYLPELVAKGTVGLAGAALTLGRGGLAAGAAGIERALARRAAGVADELVPSPRPAGAVMDLEPVGPAAREALRAPGSFTPQAVREIASESANDVVTGLKRLDPAVPAPAAKAARELKRSMDTPMGGEQAVDLAEVATGRVSAAVRAAKHRMQGSQDFARTLVAAETKKFNKKFKSKEVQEDMLGLLEGTGNPFRGADDTLEAVRGRLAKAGKLEEAEEYLARWRVETADALETLNDIKVRELGEEELDGVANYIHRSFSNITKAQARGISARLDSLSPVERRRVFETLFASQHSPEAKLLEAEGWIPRGGLKPKFKTFGEAAEHTRDAYERSLAAKRMLADLSKTQQQFGASLMVRGPEEATRAANRMGLDKPFEQFNAKVLQQMVPGEGDLYIHPEAHRILKPLVEGDAPPGAFDKAIALLKNFHFMGSFFHAGALTESNILAQGPIQGLRRAAEGGFGLPLLSRGTAKAGMGKKAPARTVEGLFARGEAARAERMLETGRPWKRVDNPAVEAMVPGEGALHMDELIADQFNTMQRLGAPENQARLVDTLGEAEAAASGLTLGRPIADTMLPLYEQVMDATIKGLERKGAAGKVAAVVPKTWQVVKRELDHGLWERLHDPSKQFAFHTLLDRVQDVKAGRKTAGPIAMMSGMSKKRLAKMSDNEIRETVAKYVNDEFGGQNWARHTGKVMEYLSRPEVQRNLRRAFISPDWNISSTRATWAPVMGLVNRNPVQTYLGVRHWTNRFFMQFAYANGINKALSGHYMWENEEGKGRGLESLKPGAAYIDTGKPGIGRYVRILKQEEDAFKLLDPRDNVSALASKMWPELGAAAEIMTKKPWEKGGDVGLFEALDTIAMSTAPFLARSVQQAVGQGNVAALMFPTSGGLRKADGFLARSALDDAFEAQDMQTVGAIQRALIDNDVPPADAYHAVDLARKRYEKRLAEGR